MAKQIALPDGSIGEFPDEMPDSEIAAALRKHFPPTKTPEGFWASAWDELKKVPPGIAEAVTHPIETGKAMYREGMALPGSESARFWKEAEEAAAKGDYSTAVAKGLYRIMNLAPGAGSMFAADVEQGVRGDLGGALGRLTTQMATVGATGAAGSLAPAAARGVASTARAAGRAATAPGMGQIATGAGEVVTGAAMLPVHPYGGAHTIRSGVTDIRAGLAKRKVGTPSKVVRPAEPHRVGFDEPVPPSLGDTAFGRAPAQPRILKGTPEPWVEMGQKPPPVAPLPSASQARQAGRFEAPPTPVIAGEPRILKATKAQPAPAPPAYPLEDLTSTLRNLDMDAKKAKGLAEIARSKYPQDFDAAVRWATGKPKPTSSAGAAPVARPPASERLPEQPRASVQATGDVEMTPLEPTARSRGEKPGQQTMGLSSESYASASRDPRVVDFAKTLHEEGISELSTVNEQSWVIVSDMVRAQKMADVVTELVAEGVPEGLASEFAERLVKPVKPPTNQVTLDLIARELERRQKMLPIRRKPG